MTDNHRIYPCDDLLRLARGLLIAAGMDTQIAAVVADVLVEGDLLGHTTHGLALLPLYLKELEQGTLTEEGKEEIIADRDSALTIDGHYLPGPWLVHRAMDLAFARLDRHPLMTVVIRRSHHTNAERRERLGETEGQGYCSPKARRGGPYPHRGELCRWEAGAGDPRHFAAVQYGLGRVAGNLERPSG